MKIYIEVKSNFDNDEEINLTSVKAINDNDITNNYKNLLTIVFSILNYFIIVKISKRWI